jgi:predicted ATPase/signal transduction histidine kinase
MLTLPNYQIHSQVYESANSFIYRGVRTSDNQPVILKFLQEDHPTPDELTRYRQEYDLIHYLDSVEGVVKAFQLEKFQNTLVIVLEDFGGESLKYLISKEKLTINEFLIIAIQIAESLGHIHAANVIHKDINPANLVWNQQTNQLKLIDFGIASRLPRENPILKSPEQLEGTLAYISPEQTGRMNRTLDYRSDLYSLGVTFYELLTGQLPFKSESPLELIHCHLAKTPTPVSEIMPEVPTMLSALIRKLMAKNAEDRYQSAFGLKHDLEQILAKQMHFELAQQDISGKFNLPQKLYGRDSEIEILKQAFEEVSCGSAELLLIAGYSGIGKTSLVQEIYKPITAKKGYFIAGKFDQLQRNIPYSALLQAFRQLIQHLLTEPSAAVQRWQQRLLAAVGNNGQVIIDVMPEIELLLGKQPAVPELLPAEAQNRFNLVFQNFIRACCQAEHPLVIFLDDLQWVDSASLKLMTLMMSDIPYLFLIGAYRDNEVTPTHPLMSTVIDIQQNGAMLQIITLSPLGLSHIEQFLADTLNIQEINKVKDFAVLLLEKTGGNPFFLGEFMKTLYAEKLIEFDYQRRVWIWDLGHIRARNITDNVVELMVRKIQQLSSLTQKNLTWAAALGSRFELSTLATVTQQDQETVSQDLWEALHAGLLIKVGETYQFVHDRVQQAAYSLISEHERPALHWQIGQSLLKSVGGFENSQGLESQLFEITDHLDVALSQIKTADERQIICKLNQLAGQKARQSAAFAAMLKYIEIAVSCLEDNPFENDYNFAMGLYKLYAEAEFLNGHFDQAAKLISLLEENAKTNLEKAEVLLLLITQQTIQAKYTESVATGRKALKLLDLELPTSDTAGIALQQALADVNALLGDRDIASLVDTPENQHPLYRLAIQLYTVLPPPLYIMGDLNLYMYVSVKATELSLRHGNIAQSPFTYACYGLVSGSALGDFQTGYQFGVLAVAVSKHFHSLASECNADLLLGSWIHTWSKPIQGAKQYNLEGYHAGMESGELQFAGYNIYGYITNWFVEGSPLLEVQNRITEYLPALDRLKNDSSTDGVLGIQQAVYQLTDQEMGKFVRYSKEINELEYIELCKPSAMAYAPYCTFKAQAFYILEQPEIALQLIESAVPFLGGMFGFTASFEYNFYHSLVLLALFDKATDQQKQSITTNQLQLKKWADSCPENFLHKWCLVEAELARVTGRNFEAIELYQQAIELSEKSEFIQDHALANELAAKFWLQCRKTKIAHLFITEAHYSYQKWGAIAKVKQLETYYSQLLVQKTTPIKPINLTQTATILSSSHASRSNSSSNWLDLESIMKAAQTLSGEIILSRLLDKMMRIVIENAGAQRGFLLLPQQEQWFIEAEGEIDQPEAKVLQSLPIETYLPETIISYVARTHNNVVLADARRDSLYSTHPYVQTHQIQSVLCFPIVYQQQLRAILYLENNLTTGAFTQSRLSVLKMLSSQIAISLENAQVMAHLDSKVKERTVELNIKINELTQARHELVQSEKMASLGRLVAGFAHELNTPIGVAIGSASALQEESQKVHRLLEQEEVDVDDLISAVSSIEKGFDLTLANLERAAGLVSSFKRTAVDQSSGEVRTFDVKEVINDTINTLRNRFKQTNIEIQMNCANDLKIKSLPGALEQILTNLLINSLIHGFEEGTRAGQINISVHLQSDHLHLKYSDNGKGIAPENLVQIFEPFFTTHRAHGGSGLGMYICYNLVTTQLQGTITCESTLGKGVEFFIIFPV